MSSKPQPSNWQNWAVFWTRIIIVLMMALIVNVAPTGTPTTRPENDYLILFAALVGVNLVLGGLLFLRITVLNNAIPYVIGAGDWILTGALAYFSGGDPLMVAGSAAVMASSGLLRLGLIVGSLHALAIFAIAYGVLWVLPKDMLPGSLLQTDINAYASEALIGVALVLGVGMYVFMKEETSQGQQRSNNEVVRNKDAEIERMRESNHAIAELITTLSSTLNYEKIVDKVLDMGRLSIRKKGNQRLVSLVLLYASEGDTMRIANARGMTSIEMSRSVRGDRGIIGKALKDCVPIIGGPPHKDPELRDFVSFSNLKSSLCIPLRAGFDNFGALFYASADAEAFTDDNIETLTALSTQATVAMQNSVLYNNLVEEKERILEMEENARKELVRDLHDIPTQTVAALTMRLRIIQRTLESGYTPEVNEELRVVEEMAQRASEEIRHVLFKLRPLILETKGLGAALEELASKTLKTYKQNISVKVGKDVETHIDTNAQGGIFYLIEEAVNNARKYAQAQMINVVVARKGSVLVVRIADNGVGFDAGNANEQSISQGSFGMTNMRERAELLSGNLKVESESGKGTVITVVIPLDASGRENGSRVPSRVANTKLSRAAKDRASSRASNRQAYTPDYDYSDEY